VHLIIGEIERRLFPDASVERSDHRTSRRDPRQTAAPRTSDSANRVSSRGRRAPRHRT
jgi:hypothetical protein